MTDRAIRFRMELYPSEQGSPFDALPSHDDFRLRFPEGAPVIIHVFDDGSWVIGTRDAAGIGRDLLAGTADDETGKFLKRIADFVLGADPPPSDVD